METDGDKPRKTGWREREKEIESEGLMCQKLDSHSITGC